MNKIISVIIATFLFSCVSAQLENTRWKTTLHAPEPRNVIFDFRKDTVTLYTVSDSAIIEVMTYTKDDTSFILTKVDGQTDCDNGSAGKYRFILKGDSLYLKLLKDDCYDRYSAIQNTNGVKWKNYPGIKVDESTLKAYTGVYAHDDAHPVTINLENGVLYATGLITGYQNRLLLQSQHLNSS